MRSEVGALGRLRTAVSRLPPPRRIAERLTRRPPVGMVRWGDLRVTTPLGVAPPVDSVERRYVGAYLAAHRAAMGGTVLEVRGRLPLAELLDGAPPWDELVSVAPHVLEGAAGGDALPARGSIDCVVAAGALGAVFDVAAALAGSRDLLRPGGTLVATFPGVVPGVVQDASPPPLWGFTPMSATRVLTTAFGVPPADVRAYGNVLSAAFLVQRLPASGLRDEELWRGHPDFPVVVGAVVRRPG